MLRLFQVAFKLRYSRRLHTIRFAKDHPEVQRDGRPVVYAIDRRCPLTDSQFDFNPPVFSVGRRGVGQIEGMEFTETGSGHMGLGNALAGEKANHRDCPGGGEFPVFGQNS